MHYVLANLIRRICPKFKLRHKGNLRISRNCFFDNALNVEFGKDVFINQFCQFHIGYSDARIRIGDSVWVGMDVCFICPTHEIGSNRQRAGMALYHDITVGNGAWI